MPENYSPAFRYETITKTYRIKAFDQTWIYPVSALVADIKSQQYPLDCKKRRSEQAAVNADLQFSKSRLESEPVLQAIKGALSPFTMRLVNPSGTDGAAILIVSTGGDLTNWDYVGWGRDVPDKFYTSVNFDEITERVGLVVGGGGGDGDFSFDLEITTTMAVGVAPEFEKTVFPECLTDKTLKVHTVMNRSMFKKKEGGCCEC